MSQAHDKRYEYKTIILLSIGFALLNLDRWVIAPLFPVMKEDLGFSYQDLGMIIGATALTWGAASFFMGTLSDKIGRRKILFPSLILLSLFSGVTGLAVGLMSMLFLRGILGIFEGAYVPTAFATVKDVSHPSRTGMNMGILGFGAAIAMGLAPIVATQLLPMVPSWHWVFVMVSVPGIIVAFLLYRIVKDPDYSKASAQVKDIPKSSIKDVMKYKNIKLAVLAMCGVMACLFVLSALLPNYLTDYLKLNLEQMGFIAAGPGFGGAVGAFLIPSLSDKFGRKPVIIISLILAAILVYVFGGIGAEPVWLFATLFGAAGLVTGALTMLDGPIATETVPPAMIGAATGVIIGVGEIFGGGIAPIISGSIAESYGISSVPYVALVGLVWAAGCCLFLNETAPIKIGKQ